MTLRLQTRARLDMGGNIVRREFSRLGRVGLLSLADGVPWDGTHAYKARPKAVSFLQTTMAAAPAPGISFHFPPPAEATVVSPPRYGKRLAARAFTEEAKKFQPEERDEALELEGAIKRHRRKLGLPAGGVPAAPPPAVPDGMKMSPQGWEAYAEMNRHLETELRKVMLPKDERVSEGAEAQDRTTQ